MNRQLLAKYFSLQVEPLLHIVVRLLLALSLFFKNYYYPLIALPLLFLNFDFLLAFLPLLGMHPTAVLVYALICRKFSSALVITSSLMQLLFHKNWIFLVQLSAVIFIHGMLTQNSEFSISRLLFETTKLGFVQLNAQSKIQEYNKGAQQILKFISANAEIKEFRGLSLSQLKQLQQQFNKQKEQGPKFNFSISIRNYRFKIIFQQSFLTFIQEEQGSRFNPLLDKFKENSLQLLLSLNRDYTQLMHSIQNQSLPKLSQLCRRSSIIRISNNSFKNKLDSGNLISSPANGKFNLVNQLSNEIKGISEYLFKKLKIQLQIKEEAYKWECDIKPVDFIISLLIYLCKCKCAIKAIISLQKSKVRIRFTKTIKQKLDFSKAQTPWLDFYNNYSDQIKYSQIDFQETVQMAVQCQEGIAYTMNQPILRPQRSTNFLGMVIKHITKKNRFEKQVDKFFGVYMHIFVLGIQKIRQGLNLEVNLQQQFSIQIPKAQEKEEKHEPVRFQTLINYLYADDLKLLKVSFKTTDKALNVKTHVANTNEQIQSIFRQYGKDGYQFYFYIIDIQFPCQREGIAALQLIRKLEDQFKFRPGFAVALEANLEKMEMYKQSDYKQGFNYVICKAMNHEKLKEIIARANQWNSRILSPNL